MRLLKSGFSLVEVIVALAMLGVIAAMIIPQMVAQDTQKRAAMLTRENFTLVGESYTSCVNSTNTAYNNCATTPSIFAQYLTDHLNAISMGGGIFTMQNGVVISGIETGHGANLEATISIPTYNNTTMSFQIELTPTRYTTLFGTTSRSCTKADIYLNVVLACP